MIVDLYNGIYKVLANDTDVLNYLGIGVAADNLSKAKHIQKRAKPQNPTDNMPLIAFYAPPGQLDRNHLVYETPFVFDIYTKDDVNKAQLIAKRIIKLFDKEIINVEGTSSFESRFLTGHESSVDLANTYCFTVVIEFSVAVE